MEKLKEMVRLEIHGYEEEEHIIIGRLLGIITEEEFQILLNNKSFQKKIFGKETVALSDFIKDSEDCPGKRLVVAAKRRRSGNSDEPADEFPMKTLFISSEIDMVSEIKQDKEVTINAGTNTFIYMEEIWA